MENKKENCESLIKRWRELKERMPNAQTFIPGKSIKVAYITPEEMDEFYKIMEQLKNKCREFLSPAERFEINERAK